MDDGFKGHQLWTVEATHEMRVTVLKVSEVKKAEIKQSTDKH